MTLSIGIQLLTIFVFTLNKLKCFFFFLLFVRVTYLPEMSALNTQFQFDSHKHIWVGQCIRFAHSPIRVWLGNHWWFDYQNLRSYRIGHRTRHQSISLLHCTGFQPWYISLIANSNRELSVYSDENYLFI